MSEDEEDFELDEPAVQLSRLDIKPTGEQQNLPVEIWHAIFREYFGEFDPVSPALHKNNSHLLYICRSAYLAALTFVYRSPSLTTVNFKKFHDTVASYGALGAYVKRLDLSYIGHSARNSLTARLIRKCSPSLEHLVAPQMGFGFSAVRAVSMCSKLRSCNLAGVSGKVELQRLCESMGSSLPGLKSVDLPRASVLLESEATNWPPRLHRLGLAGLVMDNFGHLNGHKLPDTLVDLSVSHCAALSSYGLKTLLHHLGPQLRSLTVLSPMPALQRDALDLVLYMCPRLEVLHISVEYVTAEMFYDHVPEDHPLTTLALHYSGQLLADKLMPDDISSALVAEKLQNLRSLSFSMHLWRANDPAVSDLNDLLKDQDARLVIRK